MLPLKHNDPTTHIHHHKPHANNNHSPSQRLHSESAITTTTTSTADDSATTCGTLSVKREQEQKVDPGHVEEVRKRETEMEDESKDAGVSQASDCSSASLLPKLKLSIKKVSFSKDADSLKKCLFLTTSRVFPIFLNFDYKRCHLYPFPVTAGHVSDPQSGRQCLRQRSGRGCFGFIER